MRTDFAVICAETVPADYTWDRGIPLEFSTNNATAYSTTDYVSGYAPGLRVYFENNTFSEFGIGYDNISFKWNFGDYYHDINNFVSLSCNADLVHTYIMPGTYTVSLVHTQTLSEPEEDQTGVTTRCKGKHDKQWIWDSLSGINCVTWDETNCGEIYEKWWGEEDACLGSYCKFWSWFALSPQNVIESNQEFINPVRWSDTMTDGPLEKLWMYQANDAVCNEVIEKLQQTVIKTAIVEVKEIMPVAGLECITQPQKGLSPFTVQLSPRHCKSGSFPIDRIDWDFGDGSPIKTILRHSPLTATDIINTEVFGADRADVRNYDVLHTYTRNKDEYPMFYPTLTCYSASTNSSDSCSIAIGPIEVPDAPSDIHILKTRNTLKGNIHSFINNNVAASVTTTSLVTSLVPLTFKTPAAKIRDLKGVFIENQGYNGIDYPLPYTPDCTLALANLPERYLATEDDTYDIIEVPPNLTATDLSPILTEREYFIYP